MHYDHSLHGGCCPASPTGAENMMTQSPASTFHKFQKLPAEIRNMIWEYSLPESRVYEVLDAPNANQKTPPQKGLMFANVHAEPPPALAAVCRESRYFVLHHYKPLTLGNTTKYVDLSRDILLLEPYLLVKRLHRTLHFMSQIPLLRENMNRLALGTSYGIYTGICHPVLSWRVSKGNMSKLLGSLAKFPKLRMLIFVVHQEFQFEFDFRFPPSTAPTTPPPGMGTMGATSGMMSSLPKDGAAAAAGGGYAVSSSLGSLGGMLPPSGPSPAQSHVGSGSGRTSSTFQHPTSTTTVTMPSAARNNNSHPSGYATPSPSLSPSPSSPLPLQLLPLPSTLLSGPQSQHNRPQLLATSPSLSPSPSQGNVLVPRPQQVHQAYRFKFDIEANINESPSGRPHLNEMLYYPLQINEDEDDDCWDLNDFYHDNYHHHSDDANSPGGGAGGGMGGAGAGEWCDPWPTNDDWRRFRKRFQRAINLALDLGSNSNGSGAAAAGENGGRNGMWPGGNCPPVRELHGRHGFGSGWPSSGKNNNGNKGTGGEKVGAGGGGEGKEVRLANGKKFTVPVLKGASLLWRYTRGGYV